MLLASLTVTLSLYFSGERHGGPSAGNQVLYVWIALYSGYFFSMVVITAQLGAIAGLYGGVLLVIDPGSVVAGDRRGAGDDELGNRRSRGGWVDARRPVPVR